MTLARRDGLHQQRSGSYSQERAKLNGCPCFGRM